MLTLMLMTDRRTNGRTLFTTSAYSSQRIRKCSLLVQTPFLASLRLMFSPNFASYKNTTESARQEGSPSCTSYPGHPKFLDVSLWNTVKVNMLFRLPAPPTWWAYPFYTPDFFFCFFFFLGGGGGFACDDLIQITSLGRSC